MSERVSVVIPNWNGARWLRPCLDSLERQSFRDFRVYVVDNGSDDDSRDILRADYPWVELVALPENLGFAGGMNAGFRAAKGDILIALNNDTEADPEWLSVIARAFDAPEVGFAASQLMDLRTRDVIDSLGDGFLPIGVSFKAGAGARVPDAGLDLAPVQSACAAASAYRRELLETVGDFDETFFAYMEDIDLGLRAQAAGFRGVFVPGAIVYHAGSATSGGSASAFSMRLTVRNAYRVSVKNVPLVLLPVYLAATLMTQLAVLALSFLPGKFDFVAEHRRSVLSGLGGALCGFPDDWRARRGPKMARQGAVKFIETTLSTWRLHRALR